MALVKFNKSATKAFATGSSRDKDTLYFPTDEQSIYLGGKRVGGDAVTSAETAGYATEAGQVTHTLSVKKGSKTTTYNGSTDATVTIPTTPSEVGAAPASHDHDKVYSKLGHTHTPSECGAAPTIHNHDSVYSKLGHTHNPSECGAAPASHTHDIKNITSAGEAAKRGVDTYISNAPSSADLPTSSAVKDYVDRQIKNYTSAFRYAGTLVFGSGAWRVNNIPSDISETDSMDYGTFEGGSPDETFLQTGFTFYVRNDGTFNEEQVEPGDMVTCVGLYNEEGTWQPSYNIVNSNITVTEQVDNSTKVPTARAVKSAISTAVSGLDGSAVADTNYVLTGVTETDGKISKHSQVAVAQTYSASSTNPASGKAIAGAIATLDSSASAASGKVLTGITITDGKISGKTETSMYKHPTHTATTGYPTADASPGFGGTFKVGQVASDSQGHVTGQTERTITIPSTVATDSVTGLMSSADHTKFTTIGTDVSTLKSDVATLKSDVATLKSDVTTLKSDVATLKSDVSTLKSKVSTLESNVSTLTSALTWG